VGMLALASEVALWGVVVLAITTRCVMDGCRIPWRQLIAGTVGALVLIIAYFAGSGTVAEPSHIRLFLVHPLEFAEFVLVYLGWPLAHYTKPWHADALGFAGLAGLALAAFGASRRRSGAIAILPWLWVSVYAVLVALITAVGRLHYGITAAATDRYMTGALFFWIGFAVVAAVALRDLMLGLPERVRLTLKTPRSS